MFITRRQLETFIIIGIGAMIGANLRFWISGWIAQSLAQTFPFGTLAINFTGSLVLAVFTGWATNHAGIDPRLRLLVAIGFCGGYTTFSTYANESVALLQAGDWIGALSNILGTNLICIIAVIIGLVVGRQL
jgi:CrcB protein